MHEASLARSILDAVLEVASKNNAQKVVRVEIDIGEVCLVDAEQLRELITMFAADTMAKDMEIAVNEIKTKIRCENCSYLGGVEYEEIDPGWHWVVPVFNCVRCKSNMTEIVEGRELKVKNIQVY